MAKSSFDLPLLPDSGKEGHSLPSAVVLKVILPDDPSLHSTSIPVLEELQALAETARIDVRWSITQRRQKPHRQTYVGKGKLEELRKLVEAEKPKLVLIDDPVSPGQAKNIEDHVECQVVDRTELIMDIFATHAQSHQAKLQVELAQLRYSQSRLTRMWTHLSRVEGGIGMRGPGETQLETDRRIIRRKIGMLRGRLAEIEQQGETQHKSREDTFRVALVGYTNAGKSTLMNRLTGADVLIQNQLFSTIDTCTRKWDLPCKQDVILSDTVGFIRKLPHTLVASFHATLMEVREADLLIHVVDGHTAHTELDIEAVDQTLKAIGADDKEKLILFNKVDLLPEDRRIDVQYFLDHYEDSMLISAASGVGIETLTDEVMARVTAGESINEYRFPMARASMVSRLREFGTILDEEYDEEGVVVRARMTLKDQQRFELMLKKSDG